MCVTAATAALHFTGRGVIASSTCIIAIAHIIYHIYIIFTSYIITIRDEVVSETDRQEVQTDITCFLRWLSA